MSAAAVAKARIAELFGDDRSLRAVVHSIETTPQPRASLPRIEIGAVAETDWGTKDRAGSELIVTLRHFAAVADNGQVAARVRALVPMLRGAAGGWEVVSARLNRARSEFDRQGRWEQRFELRLRCLEKA